MKHVNYKYHGLTNPEDTLSMFNIPSTVVGHHTDIVLLFVEHGELDRGAEV